MDRGPRALVHSGTEQSELILFWLANEITPHPSPMRTRGSGGPSNDAMRLELFHIICRYYLVPRNMGIE
jgi:hypothetical protein